ncbi:MAG: 30S ribosome-binding factor RbfA [Patescibacteria group bacterium]
MSQRRQERISELIQQELSQIILREVEMPEGSLLTITGVEVDKDCLTAKVFLSIFPFRYRQRVLRELGKRVGYLQFLLNRKLGMRLVPKIFFELDETEERASKIEELINKTSQTNGVA